MSESPNHDWNQKERKAEEEIESADTRSDHRSAPKTERPMEPRLLRLSRRINYGDHIAHFV